jgi:hypothetical protein
MIVFQLPKSPMVDKEGRLTQEWLIFINRLSKTGDVVVATDLPTMTQLFNDVLIQIAALQRQPQPIPDIFPDIPPRHAPVQPQIDTPQRSDGLASRVQDLEIWSLDNGR